jgi:hypothetical protein
MDAITAQYRSPALDLVAADGIGRGDGSSGAVTQEPHYRRRSEVSRDGIPAGEFPIAHVVASPLEPGHDPAAGGVDDKDLVVGPVGDEERGRSAGVPPAPGVSAGPDAYTRDPAGALVGIRGVNRSYYLFDGLGSVVALTNASAR